MTYRNDLDALVRARPSVAAGLRDSKIGKLARAS